MPPVSAASSSLTECAAPAGASDKNVRPVYYAKLLSTGLANKAAKVPQIGLVPTAWVADIG